MTTPIGRAATDVEKRVVIERVLEAWRRVPSLRLGQFVCCALGGIPVADFGGVFNAEDETIAERCEVFARTYPEVPR